MERRKPEIILFNPRSAENNHRLPLSLLQVGASLYGRYNFVFIDGNLEEYPWGKISAYLKSGEFSFFAVTVMPGPQLMQAVVITKSVKEEFPDVITIWGGYFPSNHTRVSLSSGFVDVVIRGAGDLALPGVIEHFASGRKEGLADIPNVAFVDPEGTMQINPMSELPDPGNLPPLPFDYMEKFYPMERYIVTTFIGQRTLVYHSSLGCPYSCAFCGVASAFKGEWRGKPVRQMIPEILSLKEKYRIDSLEILDSNFFASKSRVMDFCRSVRDLGIKWWAESRIDAFDSFSEDELQLLRESGCVLVFMGAESGNDDLLHRLDKGGTLSRESTLRLVRRFARAGIIPQLSFVFGFPGQNPAAVDRQAKEDIRFIRELRKTNPRTEFILYLYSPVPSFPSELFGSVVRQGFSFPKSVEEWLRPEWQAFDVRKGRMTPWLPGKTVRRIRNFETVMSAAFPGISNFHLPTWQKKVLRTTGMLRYFTHLYYFPAELKVLLKLFSYQNPEKEGFYSI